MWNQTSGMPWSELNQSVTRKRPTGEAVATSKRGDKLINWDLAPSQVLRATIQPYQGRLDNAKEGITQQATHLLFCNAQVSSSSSTPVDIAFGDRIISPRGNVYRVVFVEDVGGVEDHLEVLLKSIELGGD